MSNESSSNGAGSRASNIQKILDRKQKIFQLPKNSKMVKISTYSTCEVKIFLNLFCRNFCQHSKTSGKLFCRKRIVDVVGSSLMRSKENETSLITVLKAKTCATIKTVDILFVSQKKKKNSRCRFML